MSLIAEGKITSVKSIPNQKDPSKPFNYVALLSDDGSELLSVQVKQINVASYSQQVDCNVSIPVRVNFSNNRMYINEI